ncbi:MAG: amino acid adenylation domain-containing protein [Colwellia sp.]|nr:amino acid adenylation domain-containing protein [Colwellia sp.]
MTCIKNKITPNDYIYLDDFFEVNKSAFIDSIAVEDGESEITYAALDKSANRLANCLIDKGCKPNDRICFISSKTVAGYKSILAILKSGACFVPISGEYPDERMSFLFKSIKPKVLVVEKLYISRVNEVCKNNDLDILIIEADGTEVNSFDDSQPIVMDRTPEDLAYIIFTSGSTGMPKGVIVYHRNIVHFLNSCFNFFNISEQLRFAHCSEFTFDPSIFDIFFCWATGGVIVPMNKRSYKINPFAFFESKAINVVFTVPSVITTLSRSDLLGHSSLASIQHLIYTGEALPTDLTNEWKSHYPQCQQYNFYGTTETAIISHWYKVDAHLEAGSIVPVGYVVPGVRVILMEDNMPVIQGTVGESVVCGTQISPGYWDNDLENNVRFKSISEDNNVEHKAYFTGDLLLKDKYGCFHYQGRKDRQVKVRGHRIELLEIETVLLSLDEVEEAAVVVVKNEFQTDCIIGVISTNNLFKVKQLPMKIMAMLKRKLPAYMCPVKIIGREIPLPRNKNGKIDHVKVHEIISGENNVES